MASAGTGPPLAGAPSAHRDGRLDVDPRSALPLAAAFAGLLTTAWLVRSITRTLTSLAIALLLTLALEPLVEALQRRTGWQRRFAAGGVLIGFAVVLTAGLLLMLPPTVREVSQLDRDIPRVVEELDNLPLVGDDLREADAPAKVKEWLDELPDRLSVDAKPIERAADTITDGVAAVLLTLLLAVTLLIDGERIVGGLRGLVPTARRAQADRLGGLVYDVLGRYIAGSLLIAATAGTVMLAASLTLGVPLAPLIGMWVSMTNLIPQIGGALGALPFVLLGTTEGLGTGLACLVFFLVYQQVENHLIGPLVVGRAVHLSPPATMVAALVGVSAGGLVGALFAVPLLGAAKAVYLATRPTTPADTTADTFATPPDDAPARAT